jgi:hypothetical protein
MKSVKFKLSLSGEVLTRNVEIKPETKKLNGT